MPMYIIPITIYDVKLNTVMDANFIEPDITESDTSFHFHIYYEIQAAIDGEYNMEFQNGIEIKMLPGTVCLIPSNCYHLSRFSGADVKKLAIRFSVNKEKCEEKKIFDRVNNALLSEVNPIVFQSEELCRLMKEIRAENIGNEFVSDILVHSLLKEFYIRFFRRIIHTENEGEKSVYEHCDKRYLEIDDFFNENYAKNVTEKELSEMLYLSKRQTSRIVREIYGMSFREKLTETRLQNAIKLILESEETIEKIAYSVGYTSMSGFYSAFKRTFGMSASEYRRVAKIHRFNNGTSLGK